MSEEEPYVHENAHVLTLLTDALMRAQRMRHAYPVQAPDDAIAAACMAHLVGDVPTEAGLARSLERMEWRRDEVYDGQWSRDEATTLPRTDDGAPPSPKRRKGSPVCVVCTRHVKATVRGGS